MASMGSLAHYMQELSLAGFALRDFLHEGNGDLWLAALAHPRDHVRWILMEEVAEGGDMLAERARREPAFLAGFTRVCEGRRRGLYVRTAVSAEPSPSASANASESPRQVRLERQPAQVEAVAEEVLHGQFGVGLLVAHFPAQHHAGADRRAQAAENHRRDFGAVRRELSRKISLVTGSTNSPVSL